MIRRSYIGVGGQTAKIHRRVVRHFNLPNETGMLVVGVEPGSPASRAGLREGDIIVAFKNQPIASIDQFQRCLVAAEIGVTSPHHRRSSHGETGTVRHARGMGAERSPELKSSRIRLWNSNFWNRQH